MTGKLPKSMNQLYLITPNVYLSSLVGLVLGAMFSSDWCTELRHLVRGYRWDAQRSCIFDRTNPYSSNNICRIMENCSECESVREIEEFPAPQFNTTLFHERFAFTNRPVIIRGGASQWTAITELNWPWIRSTYLSEPRLLDQENRNGNCTFFNYKYPIFRNIRAVFRMDPNKLFLSEKRRAWLVTWTICQDTLLRKFRQFKRTPDVLSQNETPSDKSLLFISIGTNNADAIISYRFSEELYFFDAQISGEREITMTPPPECWLDCNGPMKAVLQPGDILFHSTDFWKQEAKVISEDPSISLSEQYSVN